MPLQNGKYKCKGWWIFLFIDNPNIHYQPPSINMGFSNSTSLIIVLIHISKTINIWFNQFWRTDDR